MENCKILGKFVLNSSFRLYFQVFSTNSSKSCCSFAKNKIFEKSNGGQDGGHVVKRSVAMATVLN